MNSNRDKPTGNDECIHARIDIVAFSELSKVHSGSDVCDSIKEITSNANASIRRAIISGGKDFKLENASYYGDSIDIFFKNGKNDTSLLLILLDVVADAQRMALNLGFLIRGAIVKGRLHKTEEGLSGHSMIEAHEIEKECQTPCVIITEEVMSILDEAAREKFRQEEDITDFKKNIVIDGHNLNYIEANPLGLPNSVPDLKRHRDSLIRTIERYLKILSDKPAKRKKHFKMYEYALINHNRACELYSAHEEKIEYVYEPGKRLEIRGSKPD